MANVANQAIVPRRQHRHRPQLHFDGHNITGKVHASWGSQINIFTNALLPGSPQTSFRAGPSGGPSAGEQPSYRLDDLPQSPRLSSSRIDEQRSESVAESVSPSRDGCLQLKSWSRRKTLTVTVLALAATIIVIVIVILYKKGVIFQSSPVTSPTTSTSKTSASDLSCGPY